ncbi:hypothetical protein [uncultured Pseudoteredinibacter sp.]|uniref:hypothetical protein n=1 Tax=uncultured Pseudoteredinibacter sp. TaxID=1641701 RepID=UPI00261F3C00|nr:hypothetical protein [uncultured Pseudoteredinibacter sp.]
MFSLNRLVLLVLSLLYCILVSSVVAAGDSSSDTATKKLESTKLEKQAKDKAGKVGKLLGANKSQKDKELSKKVLKPVLVDDSQAEAASKQQWQDWLKDSQREFGVGISGSIEEKINILDKSNLLDDPSGVLAEEELDEGI